MSKFSLAKQLVAIGIVATLIGSTGAVIGLAGVWMVTRDFRAYETLASDALLATEVNADMAKAMLYAQRYIERSAESDLKLSKSFLAEAREAIKAGRAAFTNPDQLQLLESIAAGADDFEVGLKMLAKLSAESAKLKAEVLDRIGAEVRAAFTRMMEFEMAQNDHELAAAIGVIQEDFLSARLYVNKFVITGNAEAVDRVEAEFKELAPAIERMLAHVKGDPADQFYLADLEKTTALITRYHDEFRRLRDVLWQMQFLSEHTFVDSSNMIAGWARELKNSKVAEEVKLAQEVLGEVSATETWGVTSAVMAVVLSMLIFSVFARNLTRVIGGLTKEMSGLASGDTGIEISGLARKDEIGAMAWALASFRDDAIEKNRLEKEAREQRRLIEAEREAVAEPQDKIVGVVGASLRELVEGDFSGGIKTEVPAQYEKLKADFNETVRQLEEYNKEQKSAQTKLAHIARHDPLTNLPNRFFFRERMENLLSGAGRSKMFALHCIDLDGFKAVNDSLGHAKGDQLLISVASRLCACVRDSDVVVRLGGDEFAVVQTSVLDMSDVQKLAVRIIEAVSSPFELTGSSVVIGCSVGIAVAPRDGHDAATLLRNADVALYRSKSEGRGIWRLFTPPMIEMAQARHGLEQDLRSALANNELMLHFQPLLDTGSNTLAGFEALMRWKHPTRGMIMPDEFIPVTEETGLIVQMGDGALREACAAARTWPQHLSIAVNVSAVQLHRRAFFECVVEALRASGLSPHRLELEITETVFAEDNEMIPAMLRKLREMGVRVSLDDFGTGYSSLSYLRNFPIDKIKIDRSFVSALDAGREDALAILRSICGIGRALRLKVAAEGVETKHQMEIIRHEGCTIAQGYLISPPLSAAEVAQKYLQPQRFSELIA